MIGSLPANASFASDSLISAALGPVGTSSVPKVRPRRIGMRSVSKYVGLTIVVSICTGASGWLNRPSAVRRYSGLTVTMSNGARELVATAWTPGTACTPVITSSMSRRFLSGGNRVMFGALTTSTLVASKPGSTRCRFTNVRTSNPAPTSTTNEMAICTATSARCARRSMRPLVERWPPLLTGGA